MAVRKFPNTGKKSSTIVESILGVIARHPSIVLAYLFGSQVQGGIGPMSDVDIACCSITLMTKGRFTEI